MKLQVYIVYAYNKILEITDAPKISEMRGSNYIGEIELTDPHMIHHSDIFKALDLMEQETGLKKIDYIELRYKKYRFGFELQGTTSGNILFDGFKD